MVEDFNKKLYPGMQSDSDLWTVKQERIERYMNNHVIPFLNVKPKAVCMDVGEASPRMEYMKKATGLNVWNWDTTDLNFDTLPFENRFDAIFAFDVLEHLQNCLWTVSQMKKALKPDGSMYINVPDNPRWLFGEEHYYEMPFSHMKKWIFDPLELTVVRHKKITFIANWKAFFIGIRPLWRVLSGQTTWRSMARSMFCWRFYIVEVKK